MVAVKERFLEVVVLALAAVAIGVGFGAASADAQSVPCADPRGCPDLIVDASRLAQTRIDKVTFAPTDCAVVEGEVQAGTRKLLSLLDFYSMDGGKPLRP